MNNFKQPGDTLTLTAPSGGVTSGTGYLIGSLFVVAVTTAAEDAPFAGRITGVVTLPRDTADTAWSEGDPIYWDADAGKATFSGGVDNIPIGAAAADAASAAATADVRLDGVTAWPGIIPSAEDTTIHDHADDAAVEVIAPAGVARKVWVFTEITEAFAGTTTEPIVQVGYGATPEAYTRVDSTSGDAGDQTFTTGELPAGEGLDVTVTDGSGGSEAGKVKVSVFVAA